MDYYDDWLNRAIGFTGRLARFGRLVAIRIDVAQRPADGKIASLAAKQGFTIPGVLKSWLAQTSEHCQCSYELLLPLHHLCQARLVVQYLGPDRLWGGPDFISIEHAFASMENMGEIASHFRDENLL